MKIRDLIRLIENDGSRSGPEGATANTNMLRKKGALLYPDTLRMMCILIRLKVF
jgi:hypothetical protein